MPSFDVVCEANMVEVKNAVEQSNKEISTRFDFKGSDSRVEQKEGELTLFADDDFKLGQVKDVLVSKMAKRSVDVRFLDYGKVEKIGGDKVKQIVTIKKGCPAISPRSSSSSSKRAKSRFRRASRATPCACQARNATICKA